MEYNVHDELILIDRTLCPTILIDQGRTIVNRARYDFYLRVVSVYYLRDSWRESVSLLKEMRAMVRKQCGARLNDTVQTLYRLVDLSNIC